MTTTKELVKQKPKTKRKTKNEVKLHITCNLRKCPTSTIPVSRCQCVCQGKNHGKSATLHHKH